MYFVIIYFLLGALVVAPQMCQAVKVEPFIHLREEYTDNLYLENNNREEEYITFLEGGVKISQGSSKKTLQGEYSWKKIFHKNWPVEDRTEHGGTMYVKYSYWKRDTLSIKLKESTYFEQRDSREPEGAGNFTKLSTLALSPSLSMSFGKGKMDIGYTYNEKRYKDFGFIDDFNSKGYMLYNHDIGKRISIALGYSHLRREYESLGITNTYRDYEEQTGKVGVKVEMPLDIKSGAHYGYVWRSYDAGVKTEYYTVKAEVGRDIGRMISGNFIYSIGEYEEVGEYQYSDEEEYRSWLGKLKITLRKRHVVIAEYGEGYYQDIYGRIYRRKKYTIEVNHDFHKRIKAAYSGYVSTEDYQDITREDEGRGGKGSIEIFFTKRFSFLLSADYEEEKYKPGQREDRLIKETVGCNYNFLDWLSLSLRYSHSDNESNETSEDYENNKYAIEMKAYF